MTLTYRFESEIPPITPLRLKVEVNTREHFAALGFIRKAIAVTNPWFGGTAQVVTYELEELLGTKLRAFYQRKKGRDLFDLATALAHSPDLDKDKVVRCFEHYLNAGGTRVSRAEFEANLADKLADPIFRGDVGPLLARNVNIPADFDAARAAEVVHRMFISRLTGEPWKGRSA